MEIRLASTDAPITARQMSIGKAMPKTLTEISKAKVCPAIASQRKKINVRSRTHAERDPIEAMPMVLFCMGLQRCGDFVIAIGATSPI